MKTNNLKAVSTEPKKEAVIFTDESVKERVLNILSATAGKVSMLSTVMHEGEECFCSGVMRAAAVSMLDDIQGAMYSVRGILENKERDE